MKRTKNKDKKHATGMASRVSKANAKKTVKRQNWLIVGLAAVLSSVLAIGSYYFWQKPVQPEPQEQLMPIRLVEIQGELSQVSKDDVLAVLRTQSRKDESAEENINFLTTDLLRLEQSLEMIPWILNTQVRRIWPDKLVIEVTEQQAVALWNNKHVVNRYGDIFTPEQLPELELPVLTGPADELVNMLATFTELQQYFEAAELQLHELHLSERRSWHLYLTMGTEVQLGRKDMLPRVKRFIDLYPLLLTQNKGPIKRVDLRYDTGMAVLYETSQEHMTSQQRQASL